MRLPAAAALFLVALSCIAAADDGLVRIPAADAGGGTVELAARLVRPPAEAVAGDAPRPAVLLLHGCDGTDLDPAWIGRAFAGWPYIFLEIDSFDARGIEHACENYRDIGPSLRAGDAHAARAWLAAQPFVDPRRIAVIGWSMGGETVLEAVSNRYINEPDRAEPFAAAIAFYPWCPLKLRRPDAPLLVLAGEADDWTPARTCRAMTPVGDPLPPYELVIYPGATHAFDWPQAPATYFGHELRYDPAAAADAYARARAFLQTYLE